MGELQASTHQLESVNFRFYHAPEIKKLSVKEISNPQTFDSLNHPTKGGLYDSALGPSDRDDICMSCGQNTVHCPGHMGHINLPLPVYNPVYFRTLYQILKASCFRCQRMIVPDYFAYVFVQKMKLLDYGIVDYFTDIDAVFNTHITVGKEMNDATKEIMKKEIDVLVQKKITEATCHGKVQTVKNVQCLKNELQSQFLTENMLPLHTCPHCQCKKKALRQEMAVKFMLSGAGKADKIPTKKRKNKDDDNDNDKEDDNDKPVDSLTGINMDKLGQVLISPTQAQAHVRLLWQNDSLLLTYMYKSLADMLGPDMSPVDIFFLDVVPVSPSRFRPLVEHMNRRYENPQTVNMNNLLTDSVLINTLLTHMKKEEQKEETPPLPSSLVNIEGSTLTDKFQNLWLRLQMHVNVVVDQGLVKTANFSGPGIKQILEKKEGLFRKHMMGKRVNFAARSVISPDPFINTNEIGVPEVFAKKLTYSQPVTPWNINELRQAVINGPDVHPGACYVINENGSRVMLNPKDKTQREAVAKQLLTNDTDVYHGKSRHGEGKKVLRHLKNGDVMLLNRQPTLHRPSIQAHKARVLTGEKTLRLHYSNCKAYNADFDGDEMNAHFPQNELARAEAYTLMSTDYQYLVPKDGTPLAGLIQDHMVSGVNLSLRGRFFNRQEYCQLVFTALTDQSKRVKTLPPAIRKPKPLWSGKQVLSTLILNTIPSGKEPLHLDGTSKITEKAWLGGGMIRTNYRVSPEVDTFMGESHVVIRGGELLCGVLDKGHYGNTPYGLVHCCYELYGGAVAGKLLTGFSRLFTNFLQFIRGFTLGVHDILVTDMANRERAGEIEMSKEVGEGSAMQSMGLDEEDEEDDPDVLLKALKEAQFDKDDQKMKELDLNMKSRTDNVQNNIVKSIMPKGLTQLFPLNNLQLMVQSGAKGSSVNCMQISCLLGQIELEGRRPPPMLSGKTLPSFKAYEVTPRSGGFVTGRFLTGIRPQEYFFHCMAGREFYYGEDGLDVSKTGFLKPETYPFLLENKEIMNTNVGKSKNQGNQDRKEIKRWKKKIAENKKKMKRHNTSKRSSGFLDYTIQEEDKYPDKEIKKNGRSGSACKMCDAWRNLDESSRKRYSKSMVSVPDPVASKFKPYSTGVLPEKLEEIMNSYSKSLKKDTSSNVNPKHFHKLMNSKLKQSFAEPGEAVGPLCAQSIGEPSTQMTLNTFHFAGRGEMNVTLGIPRLVEILMVGSKVIKTPSMDIPVYPTQEAKQDAKKIQTLFNQVLLSQVLENVEVTEFLAIRERRNTDRTRKFQIKYKFLPYSAYKHRMCVNPASILQFMEQKQIRRYGLNIRKKIAELTKARIISSGKVTQRGTTRPATSEEQTTPEDAGDDSDNELDVDKDDDNVTAKEASRMEEEQEYDEGGDEPGDGQVMDEEEHADYESEVEMDDNDNKGDESYENNSDEDEEEDVVDEFCISGGSKQQQIDSRIKAVKEIKKVCDYSFDVKKQLWCTVTYEFPLLDSKVDLPSLLEEEARKTIVHEVPGIKQCFLTEENTPQGKQLHLKTDGINIQEIYKYMDILDMSGLYSNHIHEMANTYGIEAAAKVIIKEIQNVFAAYGIVVDYRHLSLLADYMTFEGVYKPFNRMALETSSSPLQQMSFETTMHFLVKAALQGKTDHLKNPSSQLVVGRVMSSGTGSFELLQPLV